MSEPPAGGLATADRSALARAWIASVVTVISVGTMVLMFILAPLPALAGLLMAASGVRKNNPYRMLNRMLLVVCTLVIAASVLLSLLLLAAGHDTTSVSTPSVVSR